MKSHSEIRVNLVLSQTITLGLFQDGFSVLLKGRLQDFEVHWFSLIDHKKIFTSYKFNFPSISCLLKA